MGSFRPRLIEAETASARMDALCEFLEFWLGPRQDDYGEPVAKLDARRLPMPLRRLSRFAGRWPHWDERSSSEFVVPALAHQDNLLALQRLTTADDGKLIFLDENQSVWDCRTLPDGDDPPVWCFGDHMNEQGEWLTGERLVSDSLSRFLVTFAMQELTFGSRLHVCDTVLAERFRSEAGAAVPVWDGGPYVHGDDWRCVLWGDVLVAEQFGDLLFAANYPEGISFLKANQGPVGTIEVMIHPSWTLDIKADGSARLRYRHGETEAEAEAPSGAFPFAELLETLTARASEEGHFERNPMLFLFRPSQSGGVQGQHLHDHPLVASLFRRMLEAMSPPNPELLRLFQDDRSF
jgi:hypothetical protein